MTTGQTIPPMPTEPPTVGVVPPEAQWWRALYEPAPVAEAETAPDPEPVEPRPHWWAGRLPDWRKGETANLDTPVDEPEHEPDDEDTDPDTPDNEQVQPDTDEPSAKNGTPKPQQSSAQRLAQAKKPTPRTPNHRARAILFNATAASAGYLLGIVPLLGHTLPAAEQTATGMVSLLLAAGGAAGAWKLTSLPYVSVILPFPAISRVLATAGAAEFGRRLAPAPVTWLDAHGASYGLGPSAVSLLITSCGICTGLWWLIDRNTRTWWWGARWMVRIPLASALLATALYTPGSTL